MRNTPQSRPMTVGGRPSMPQDRQHDLQRDQLHHDNLQHIHPRAAGLLDEEVVDVADGLRLAPEPAPGARDIAWRPSSHGRFGTPRRFPKSCSDKTFRLPCFREALGSRTGGIRETPCVGGSEGRLVRVKVRSWDTNRPGMDRESTHFGRVWNSPHATIGRRPPSRRLIKARDTPQSPAVVGCQWVETHGDFGAWFKAELRREWLLAPFPAMARNPP